MAKYASVLFKLRFATLPDDPDRVPHDGDDDDGGSCPPVLCAFVFLLWCQ